MFGITYHLNSYSIWTIPLNWSSTPQQVVSIFGNTYLLEPLFSKMKHAKSMLHSQLLNHLLSDGLCDVGSSRWPVCLIHSGRNQITWLPLLSWRNHHYSPRCKFFLSEQRCFSFFRLVQQWESIWLGSTPKEKSLFMEKIVLVATIRTLKETSNTFDSLIINKFSRLLSLSHVRRNCTNALSTKEKVTRDLLTQLESDREREPRRNLMRPDGVRGTTTDPCLLLLLRFGFWALFTKLSGFALFLFPSLGSDQTSKIQVVFRRLQRFCLTAQNVCLSLTAASESLLLDC